MTAARDVRPRSLLLSLAPARHGAALRDLSRLGLRVRVVRCPRRAFVLLDTAPALVIVDLAHGPAVDERVVHRLNRLRGAVRVYAIHDGDLQRFARCVDGLQVDGFCPSDDLRPLAAAGAAVHQHLASAAIH